MRDVKHTAATRPWRVCMSHCKCPDSRLDVVCVFVTRLLSIKAIGHVYYNQHTRINQDRELWDSANSAHRDEGRAEAMTGFGLATHGFRVHVRASDRPQSGLGAVALAARRARTP